MMNYIWVGMIALSVVSAAFQGRAEELAGAVINSAESAIALCLTLAGTICLWGGLMRIAEKSGMTRLISRLMRPLLSRIFPDLESTGETAQAISMNITANLLGLGNAATPLGLEAMRRMKGDSASKTATASMVKFVVINSAAFHLIPTTVAALRARYGAENPFDIMPAAWVSSLAALTVGLTLAQVLLKISEGGQKKWRR